MKYQTHALEAYARGFALTHDEAFREDARKLEQYLAHFLTAPDGTFYANQDADLNAHAPDAPFVDGHVYYAGAYWDNSVDPDGAGVFARRRQSLQHNVRASRFFSALAQLTHDAAWTVRAQQALAGVATPANLDEEGAWLGEFLLALEEAAVSPPKSLLPKK